MYSEALRVAINKYLDNEIEPLIGQVGTLILCNKILDLSMDISKTCTMLDAYSESRYGEFSNLLITQINDIMNELFEQLDELENNYDKVSERLYDMITHTSKNSIEQHCKIVKGLSPLEESVVNYNIVNLKSLICNFIIMAALKIYNIPVEKVSGLVIMMMRERVDEFNEFTQHGKLIDDKVERRKEL